MGHLIIPMTKKPLPLITQEIIDADPFLTINNHGKIMNKVPHWTDEYIELNSDNKFECFDEWDHLLDTVETKEQAKKVIEKFFE